MRPVEKKSPLNWELLLECLLLSYCLLLVDIFLPLGIAGGVLHVIVVLLALRSSDLRYPIGFAILGSVLVLVGLLLSEPMGIPWMVYTNRGIALLAIWATTLLGLRLKHYQAKLSESEGRFQLMADNAPLMIWRTDSQGNWDFISQGWLDFTGRSPADEQGQGWLGGVHVQDRDAVLATYHDAIARHQRFEVQCRVRSADSGYRWVGLQGVPREDFSGFIGTALDITQRVEAEIKLKEARQKYYHREKMAMIGTLAEGVLHEIGNPTASIAGLVQEALAEYDRPAKGARPARETLVEIQHQVSRITEVSRDIMNFTRLQDSSTDVYDFNQLIDRTCRLIRHDDRMHSTRLVLDLDTALPAVEVVPDTIIQLLFNLIENAIEASHGLSNTEIKVATRRVAQGVELSVSDQGTGMSPETLNHARDISLSTQPEEKGFGLALCKAIAEEYDGTLTIESALGQGTEVRVTLHCAAPV